MPVTRRRRSVIINSSLGVAVLVVGAGAYVTVHDDPTAKAATRSSSTATVARGTVLAEVSASGSVSSAHTAEPEFATSGTVAHIDVKLGEHVGKGQTIATEDDTAQRADVVTQRARLASARDKLTTTEDDDRATSAQIATARAQVTSAKAQLTQAERALAGTVLTAPISGTVTAVNGSVGSGSSSGTSSSGTGSGGSGTSGSASGGASSGSSDSSGSAGSSGFVEIVDMRHLQVTADVDEADTLTLKKGQTATVSLNAKPGTSIPAKLTAIDPNPVTSDNVVHYAATIALRKRPKGIRIGQTATVDIVTAKADDTLYVPTTAVRTAGGRSTVTVISGGKQVTKDVKVGVQGGDRTAIRSGLDKGDRVVLTTGSSSSGGGFPKGGFPGRGGGRRMGGPGGSGGGPGGGAGR